MLNSSSYTKFGLLQGVNVIFEVGSRDCRDAMILAMAYPTAKVFAFEANPEAWSLCNATLNDIKDPFLRERLTLVPLAATDADGIVNFKPFDLNKYDNIGASSLFEIDFKSNRSKDDPDYGRENVQKTIAVQGVRLDMWAALNGVAKVDFLCMDVQGAELLVVKGLGEMLCHVKAIIAETSVESTYKGGASFSELDAYLTRYGLKYLMSDMFGRDRPPQRFHGFSEFNAVWIR